MKALITLIVLLALGCSTTENPNYVQWRSNVECMVNRWSANAEPNVVSFMRTADRYQAFMVNDVDSFYCPDSAWLLTISKESGWGFEWTYKQERDYGKVIVTKIVISDTLLAGDTLCSKDTLFYLLH